MRYRILCLLLAAAAGGIAAELGVRVYNRAAVSRPTLKKAERHAGAVFRAFGTELNWIDCKVDSPCEEETPSGGIKLTLLPKPRVIGQRLSENTFGLVLPTGVLVFPDRTGELARWYGVSQAAALGLVLTHELGHALLGAGHSSTGVMKAPLTARDLRSFAEGQLRFTAEQAALLRRVHTSRQVAFFQALSSSLRQKEEAGSNSGSAHCAHLPRHQD